MTTRHEHALGWHYSNLSDFELRLVIRGRSIMKKNSMVVRRIGRRASVGPSTEYQRWERDAVKQLVAQWAPVFRQPIPKSVPLNLRVVTYLPSRMGWPDLSASYEGPQDVLEAHRWQCSPKCNKHSGVILNDSQICGHVGSDRRVDKTDPRVELTLTPYRAE